MSRFLDWIDEAAGGLIRILYLAWGIAAVASYFGAGDMPPALSLALVTLAPWLIAAALETHTYLTARRVRSAWQQKDSRSLKVNLAILSFLLAFSMLNQLQYLGETWRPPAGALALPGIWAYALRALVVPAAFMAAAFLAPVGESLTAKVQAEAHRFADATFKVARKQWRARLEEMGKQNQDVTGALVQLVDDPDERRVIETIHTAMYPQLPPPDGGTPMIVDASTRREPVEEAPQELLRLITPRPTPDEQRAVEKRARTAGLRATAYALLDHSPHMRKNRLRKILGCAQTTADRLYAEWQQLQREEQQEDEQQEEVAR